MTRKSFPGITKEAFVSDADRRALNALESIPLLSQVVRKFYEHGFDRWMYVYNMSRAVRCGPKQHHTLFEMMEQGCKVLDMPVPELYVTNNPFPNAFAGGVERPYIVLRSSIVDMLSDEELMHLIGHELGHIKAGHVLYFTIAQYLLPLLELLGRRTLGLGDAASIGLVLAFYEWVRQAEISADRAGLLVSQDLGVSIDANLKMCGGSFRFGGEMSREAFMEQARAYSNTETRDAIGKVIWFWLMNWQSTHPMFVHRVQMLERWVDSGDYDRIIAGGYTEAKV